MWRKAVGSTPTLPTKPTGIGVRQADSVSKEHISPESTAAFSESRGAWSISSALEAEARRFKSDLSDI